MAGFSPNRWFSQCVFQELGQELVNGLKACLEGQCPIKVGISDPIPVVAPRRHLAMTKDALSCHSWDGSATGI